MRRQARTVERLFANRRRSFELYNLVRKYIESIGPVEIRVTRTLVSFSVRTGFAWVWLPQLWIRQCPEESITLAFQSDRRIKDSRIKQAVEPRPGRWMHHIVMECETDLDDKVKAWIRQAYEFGKLDRRKKAV